MIRIFSAFLLILTLAGCDIFKPSRVDVPTTDVTIVPPKGYVVSKRFPGVEDIQSSGSITVNVFPVQSIGSLGALFASVERATPTLNNRGIHVEGTETITWKGKPVLLFRGNQKDAKGVIYEKWIAVFVEERPIMVAFQEPRPGKLNADAIIAAFASVDVKARVE